MRVKPDLSSLAMAAEVRARGTHYALKLKANNAPLFNCALAALATAEADGTPRTNAPDPARLTSRPRTAEHVCGFLRVIARLNQERDSDHDARSSCPRSVRIQLELTSTLLASRSGRAEAGGCHRGPHRVRLDLSVRQRLTVGVADDVAARDLVGAPGWRKAACSHVSDG
jgi:hypothetical protein